MREKFNNHRLLFLSVLVVVVFFITFLVVWMRSTKITVDITNQNQYDYSCEDEIDRILEEYKDSNEKLDRISDVDSLDKVVAINLLGKTDKKQMDKVLDILEKYNAKVSYFISSDDLTGLDTKRMIKAGSEIQNYGMTGKTHMEKATPEEITTQICRGNAVAVKMSGKLPTVLKLPMTDMKDKNIESISRLSGVKYILGGSNYLNWNSFKNSKKAQAYVNNLAYGEMINIKLSGYIDELEMEDFEKDERPAHDKKPGHKADKDSTLDETNIYNVIEWLCAALKADGYKIVLTSDLEKYSVGDVKTIAAANKPKKVPKRTDNFVYTTDREVGLVFKGIKDLEKVKAVIKETKKLGGSASFWVTGSEALEYKETVKLITEEGFQIINGGLTGKYMGEAKYEDVFAEVYMGKLAIERAGAKTDVYIASGSSDTKSIRLAAKASGMKMVNYGYNILNPKLIKAQYSPRKIIKKSFNKSRDVLCRGDILLMDLDFDIDAEKMGNVISELYKQRIKPICYDEEDEQMRLVTLDGLMDNLWKYPINNKKVSDRIKLNAVNGTKLYSRVRNNHIEKNLITDTKINGNKIGFISFDDWGDEKSIGQILRVLRKHNVKATFFIITEHINGNTANLLREIAEEKHSIGSHSNSHFVSDVTSQKKASELADDLVTSNKILASVVGDTGRLTTFYRPPTLAMSRLGKQTVFGVGYTHIIGGDDSTGDYKAKSSKEIYNALRYGELNEDGTRTKIQNGTNFIMHMSKTTKYTPKALDEYLTWQESLPDGHKDKYSFELLSDHVDAMEDASL